MRLKREGSPLDFSTRERVPTLLPGQVGTASSVGMGATEAGYAEVMRTFYVVTHPEVTHHRERLVGGWHDSELTPQGGEDAQRIAAELGRVVTTGEPVEVYTSDLKRATQTAEVTAEVLGVTAIADRRLREKS